MRLWLPIELAPLRERGLVYLGGKFGGKIVIGEVRSSRLNKRFPFVTICESYRYAVRSGTHWRPMPLGPLPASQEIKID